MTRQQRAINFAKKQATFMYPELASKQMRITWWSNFSWIEKRIFLQMMMHWAEMDLDKPEPLEVIKTY